MENDRRQKRLIKARISGCYVGEFQFARLNCVQLATIALNASPPATSPSESRGPSGTSNNPPTAAPTDSMPYVSSRNELLTRPCNSSGASESRYDTTATPSMGEISP